MIQKSHRFLIPRTAERLLAGRRRGRRRTPGVACAGRTHAGVRQALGGRPVYERRAVAVRGLAGTG